MLIMMEERINLTGSITGTLAKGFYASIEIRDQNTFYQLNQFLNQRLRQTYDSNNLIGFVNISALLVWYYEYALLKLNSSITYKDICNTCTDSAAKSLKDKAFGFRSRMNSQPLDLDEQQKINTYGQVVVNRFSELINVCLRNNGLQGLSRILNQLDQVFDPYNYELNKLKWEVRLKQQEKLDSKQQQELEKLKMRYGVEGYLNESVRLSMKATLFWSFYLYSIKIISLEELQSILEIFDSYRGYIESDFEENLVVMRRIDTEQKFGWAQWDYTERKAGQPYSPPSVSHWVTLGAVIYQLRNNLNFVFDFNIKDPQTINSYEDLISNMQEVLKFLKEGGFLMWGSVVNTIDENDFLTKIKQAEDKLSQLKNKTITTKEIRIADLSLDEQYVENFRKLMREGWEKGNVLRELFIHFTNIQYFEEQGTDPKMFIVGYHKRILLGIKSSLIRDPNYHIPMYGIEVYGQEMADNEENLFLQNAMVNVGIDIINILPEIDRAIQEVKQNGYYPSVIMVSIDTWSRTFRSLNSPDFIFDWNDKQGYSFSNFGGVYKDLPIVKLRDPVNKNSVIVADFKAAFLLQQRRISGAYKNILKEEIRLISEEEAKLIIAENPAYWEHRGNSQEDAIIKLRNSVMLDFYLLENFLITEKAAFAVLKIKV